MADEYLRTSQKSGRGRPRVLPAWYETEMDKLGLLTGKTSRRAKLDAYYCFEALNALGHGKDKRFNWLADNEAMAAGKPKSWRPTILAELGKIGNPDTIRGISLQLCNAKPTTRDAIVMIRRWRGTLKGKPTVKALSNVISGAVINYADSHGFDETYKILDEAWQLAFMQLAAMWAMRQPGKPDPTDDSSKD